MPSVATIGLVGRITAIGALFPCFFGKIFNKVSRNATKVPFFSVIRRRIVPSLS